MRISVPSDHAGNPFAYVMSHYAQNLAKAATDFSQAAFLHSKLSFREFEGARLRTAQINGCLTCQGFRPAQELTGYLEYGGHSAVTSVATNGAAPDESYYQAVSEWRSSPVFSTRERLAIEFAERIGLDPQGIAEDEEFWRGAKQSFNDEDLVDLSCCVAGWMGLGRLTHALGLDGACSFTPPAAAPMPRAAVA